MQASPTCQAVNPWERGTIHSQEEFVAYVDQLCRLAHDYDRFADPTRLVLDYLRHQDYDSYQWRTLVGPIDDSFVDHVARSGIAAIKWVRHSLFPSVVKVSHLAASAVGVYVHGRSEGRETNHGDIAGWGGDWMTFYGEWRRDSDLFRSGQEFADLMLMRDEVSSPFQLTDILDDADAHLLGTELRTGSGLAETVAELYGTEAIPRLALFFEERFFGSAPMALVIATGALTENDDLLVSLGRSYLVEAIARRPILLPSMLPRHEVDSLSHGFVNRLLDLTATESALIAARTHGVPSLRVNR